MRSRCRGSRFAIGAACAAVQSASWPRQRCDTVGRRSMPSLRDAARRVTRAPARRIDAGGDQRFRGEPAPRGGRSRRSCVVQRHGVGGANVRSRERLRYTRCVNVGRCACHVGDSPAPSATNVERGEPAHARAPRARADQPVAFEYGHVRSVAQDPAPRCALLPRQFRRSRRARHAHANSPPQKRVPAPRATVTPAGHRPPRRSRLDGASARPPRVPPPRNPDRRSTGAHADALARTRARASACSSICISLSPTGATSRRRRRLRQEREWTGPALRQRRGRRGRARVDTRTNHASGRGAANTSPSSAEVRVERCATSSGGGFDIEVAGASARARTSARPRDQRDRVRAQTRSIAAGIERPAQRRSSGAGSESGVAEAPMADVAATVSSSSAPRHRCACKVRECPRAVHVRSRCRAQQSSVATSVRCIALRSGTARVDGGSDAIGSVDATATK